MAPAPGTTGTLERDTLIPEPDILPALLQQAIRQAFNAVLITDAQPGPSGPRILYANPAFCRMTGYAVEELLGKTPRLLQGPQTDPAVLESLREHLRTGRHFRSSTVNYRKDGTPYTVEWSISPVRDEAGTITHFVSVQQDISDLVAAQHSSQLLVRALDVAQDAIFITNAEGMIEFVNQGFELVTGYSAAEVQGRTPALFKSGKQDEAFYRRLWHDLKSGQTFRATVANRHKDGRLIHCEETVTPIHDHHGEVTHFVSIIKDLTERVQVERELRQQARLDGLTGLLNRRSGELQLERAHQAAREGCQSFCVMLADIDHFKGINDTWGHPAGDAVLQAVAALLQSSVRATDSVARWGGEEFLLVLPCCEVAAANKLAERIRERLDRTPQPGVGRITLSIGVAQARQGESLTDLVERVDKALYRAKQEGRNRVCGA
ncbi:sensor domain-containing diguanylate cyclase [Azotobacter salinestris]|uniref:sensor domain-containing diguanylate cyclase n=1 Tax=Azotobacter salinestris TaxID=69964 RepID=UPI001266AA42|nr:sensor domain-containing diguanylate cyclase [Azotobacter salinestris]